MGRAAIIATKETFDRPELFLSEVKFKQVPDSEVVKLVLSTIKTYSEATAILRVDERIGYFPIIIMEDTRMIGANFIIESIVEIDESSLVFNAREVYNLMRRNKQL